MVNGNVKTICGMILMPKSLQERFLSNFSPARLRLVFRSGYYMAFVDETLME